LIFAPGCLDDLDSGLFLERLEHCLALGVLKGSAPGRDDNTALVLRDRDIRARCQSPGYEDCRGVFQ